MWRTLAQPSVASLAWLLLVVAGCSDKGHGSPTAGAVAEPQSADLRMSSAAVPTSQPQSQPTSRPSAASTRPATAASRPAAEPQRRVHVFVSGVVQGVGFRDFTFAHAHALGVKGFVQNLHDGRVEAVFQGTPDQIRRILDAVRKGPPAARVKDLKLSDESVGNEFTRFEVRR